MRYKNLDEFYKEYIAKPIKAPTKEEAIERLTKLRVLDKDGNIADGWKDIIVETNNDVIAGEIRNKLEEFYAPGYFPHFEHR